MNYENELHEIEVEKVIQDEIREKKYNGYFIILKKLNQSINTEEMT